MLIEWTLLTIAVIQPDSTDSAREEPDSTTQGQMIRITPGSLASSKFPNGSSENTYEVLRELGPIAGRLGLTAFIIAPYDSVLFSYDSGALGLSIAESVRASFVEIEGRLDLSERRPRIGGAGFHVKRLDDYGAVIDAIASKYTYLENWAVTAKSLNGFAIYVPAVFGIIEDQRSEQRANILNVAVHQTTMIALYQYFGFQPYWIREGMALDIEAAITDQLYAFSMSDEFVPEKRPKGWRRDMAQSWRRGSARDMDSLFRMTTEDYERSQSLRAMALVHYLSSHNPRAFVDFLDALDRDRSRGLQIEGNYMPDEVIQERILAQSQGDRWREDAIPEMQRIEKRTPSNTATIRTSRRR